VIDLIDLLGLLQTCNDGFAHVFLIVTSIILEAMGLRLDKTKFTSFADRYTLGCYGVQWYHFEVNVLCTTQPHHSGIAFWVIYLFYKHGYCHSNVIDVILIRIIKKPNIKATDLQL
jgi:hypothetical protein